MSPPLPQPPLAPLRQAIHALATYTHTLLARLRTAPAGAPTHVPAPAAALQPAAQRRLTSTLHWLHALSLTLRGDLTYLKTFRFKSYNLPTPPDLFAARKTEAERAAIRATNRRAAQTRRIRTAFAREPIGTIAARLCHRLEIQPGHPLYPAPLIAITQTPRQWANQVVATRVRAIMAIHGRTQPEPNDLLRAAYGPTLRPPRRVLPRPWPPPLIALAARYG